MQENIFEVQVLLIDNYDSFTYNLVQILEECGADVLLMKNDNVNFDKASLFNKIVLSPGPGLPAEAGCMMKVIHLFHKKASFLGVCLGHQAIIEYFGGQLKQVNTIRHGHQNTGIIQKNHILFNGLDKHIAIGHYHSWVATEKIPDDIVVTMTDDEGHVMAVRHKAYDLHGVQFHPESVMTPTGKMMIENWLNVCSMSEI